MTTLIELTPLLTTNLVPFPYTGYGTINSVCGVFVLRHAKPVAVVLTELPNNPGTSVTNRAEKIASLVRAKYLNTHLDPAAIRWIEHYPPGRGISAHESFDWLTFDWNAKTSEYSNPRWTRLSNDELAWLHSEILQTVQ